MLPQRERMTMASFGSDICPSGPKNSAQNALGLRSAQKNVLLLWEELDCVSMGEEKKRRCEWETRKAGSENIRRLRTANDKAGSENVDPYLY